MAQTVIIDTDILIDFSRDKPDAVQTMASLEQKFEISVSVITAMELYTGCRSEKDLKKVDEFLSDFKIYFLTKTISNKAFELMREFRSSQGTEINDMLIASTAIIDDSKFITKNIKHYKFLDDLELLGYPYLEDQT